MASSNFSASKSTTPLSSKSNKRNLQTYHDLYSPDESKYTWKIKARVIRLWKIYYTSTDENGNPKKELRSINMILVDDKHNRVQAVVWETYVPLFKSTFNEGEIYVIYNFMVRPYKKETYRCVHYDKLFWFSNHTEVTHVPQGDSVIPTQVFDFTDLADVPEILDLPDQTQLIDVIGVVQTVQPITVSKNSKGEDQSSIRFTLTDGSSTTKCWLWDILAEEFDECLSKATERPVILIISSCRVKNIGGSPTLCNLMGTAIFLNYNHDSVRQVRERILDPEFKLHQEPIEIDDDEQTVLQLKHIQNLGEEYKEKEVLCQVTVISVQDNESWFVDICPTCKEEIELVDGKKYCVKCQKKKPFPRTSFRLCVLAKDNTDTVAIVLMDREVSRIPGTNVLDLIAEQRRLNKKDEFPEILRTIVGNQYTITLQLSEDNTKHNSNVFIATDILKGFELPHQSTLAQSGMSSSYRMTQFSSNSEQIHLTDINLKTPDTEKSTATKKIKRHEKDIVTEGGEANGNGEHGKGFPSKQLIRDFKTVKKEHV